MTQGRSPSYPLEPLRQREEWRLDVLEAELGQCSRHSAAARDRHTGLVDERQALSVAFSRAGVGATIDPGLASNRLHCLMSAAERIAAAAVEARELEQERERIRAMAACQRDKVDALVRDRERHEARAASAAARAHNNELDRDWLARARWCSQRDGKSGGLV